MKTYNVGITFSTFDLLHPGHVIFLRECKKLCEYLLVGLHVDPSVERATKNSPVQTVYERYVQLKGCTYVDDIIPYQTELDLLNILKTNPIDVRFLGTDYIDVDRKSITGWGYGNIVTHFINRDHSYSSTELRKRIK
jgi:glycerol-3-phosphate cytidylyltransferase